MYWATAAGSALGFASRLAPDADGGWLSAGGLMSSTTTTSTVSPGTISPPEPTISFTATATALLPGGTANASPDSTRSPNTLSVSTCSPAEMGSLDTFP